MIRAKLKKESDGEFGVHFTDENAGTALIVRSVSDLAHEAGLRPGQQLVELIAGGMEYDVSRTRLRALLAILSRQNVVEFVCCSVESAPVADALASLSVADSRISHESSPVHTLRGLLSPQDVQTLHEAATRLQRKQVPHTYDNELINNSTDDLPFGLRPQHESVFLHEDGFLARECPELCQRILAAVRSKHAGDGSALGVRCIEYHTYRIGGALLDPEHRDMGSVLTMSCLLTSPEDVDGGVFMTWEDGRQRLHDDLDCGDAVIFHSERVHNVSAVMGGTRHSLVVELWEGGDNQHDRHA